MGRLLAIDYGRKRVGLAVTDELKIIAGALDTVRTVDIINYLKEYLGRETVELVIVGKPVQMNYKDSEAEAYIIPFIKQLNKEFPDLPVVRHDERFTSKMAKQAVLESGVSKTKRQNKELIDKVSATIILQSYLETLIK